MCRFNFFIFLIMFSVGISAQGIYSEDDIKVQRLFIQANQYKILGKFDKAIKSYESILDHDPLNAAAQHDLARVLLASERNDEAIKAGKNAVKYEPSNVWYQLTLSEIYDADGDCHNAANTLASIIKLKQDNDLYRRWFRAHVLCENWPKALEVTDHAIAQKGLSLYWLDESVNMFLEMGKEKEAIKRVQSYLNDQPEDIDILERLTNLYLITGAENKADKVLNQILLLDPTNEFASYQKAKKENDLEDSDGDLLTMVKDSRLDLDYKIRALIPALHIASSPIELTELLSCAEHLISEYSDDAKPYALKGDVHMMMDNYKSAIDSYEKTISIDKSNYQVWSQMLYAYMITGRYDELEERSYQAMDYYPNQSGPYLYYAMSGLELNDVDQAAEYLEEFRFIGSKESFMVDLSYLLEGRLMMARGASEQGIKVLQEYITQSKSQNPKLLELLGDLHFDKGDKAQSEKYWRQAIDHGGDIDKLNSKIESI